MLKNLNTESADVRQDKITDYILDAKKKLCMRTSVSE